MLPSTVTNSSLQSCPVVVELHRSQLVRPYRNAGLATHNLHQHPDAPIRRDLLDLGHEVGKRACVERHLIARLQQLGRQHFLDSNIKCNG